MAAKSDGQVVIEIIADDKKLSEGLNRVNENAAGLANELSRVDELLQFDPKNIQLVEQREKLLNEAIANTREKLEMLRDAQTEANKAFSRGEISEQQYRSLQREIVRTKQELKGLTEQTKKHAEAEHDAKKETQELGSAVTALSATAAAAATALTVLIGKTSAAATEYEAAFAKTQTIMDSAQVTVADMNDAVIALSVDSAMSAGTVSEAVYQAISGSVATADAVGFVDKANKLAVSGFTSLGNATDILTTTLNAYHMKAEQVGGISNVLIQTQNLGKTSVNQLAANMGRAIATGSAYGVNLQNIATAYVELTRAGIATAEATTYLSGMLNELGKADSEVATVLQEQTGKSFGQLMADGYSLGNILQILSTRVKGNSEAFMGLWGSQEAAKAGNALLSMTVADFNTVLAQMDDELKGTTGTTEQAYDTMTHTSEFIDKKLANSVNNLSIAFGDTLNPTIDAAKEFLTGVTERAAELIEQYPALAYIGAGVVAGIVAVSASLAIYVVKMKLATYQTLAFTAAMNSNGVTALISAIGLAAAALVTYITYTLSARKQVNALSGAAAQLEQTMESAGETLAESRAEIEASAAAASSYVDELERMERAGISNRAEAERWHATLVMLTEAVPELAEYIDLETDSIEGGTAALRRHIDAWQETAKQKAYQEYLSAYYSDMAQAEIELEKNRVKRYEAQRKENELLAKREKLWKRQTALETEAAKKAEDHYKQYGELTDATDYLTAEYRENEDAISHLSAEIEDARVIQRNYAGAIADGEAALAAARKEVGYAQKAYKELMGTASEATDGAELLAYGQQQAAMVFSTCASTLAEAYEEVANAARESIDGQITAFTKFDPVVAESVSNMIGALNSEADYLSQYADNMKIASARGVSKEILQALSDGSVESAKRLAGIVAATDEQITELNESWARAEEGKDDFADAIAEYTGILEDEKQVMVDLMAEAGIDMSDALVRELLAGLPAYLDALGRYEPTGLTSSDRVDYPGLGIRGYAAGTVNAAVGYALVGENGPELVYFHGGERVLNAADTEQTLAAVYPTAPALRSLGTGLPASVGGGTARLRATICVPLEIDGHEFARATAEYVGEEMEFGVI